VVCITLVRNVFESKELECPVDLFGGNPISPLVLPTHVCLVGGDWFVVVLVIGCCKATNCHLVPNRKLGSKAEDARMCWEQG